MATDRFAEAEFLKYVNKVNLVIFIPGFRTAPARSVQIWLWSRDLSEQSRWTVLRRQQPFYAKIGLFVHAVGSSTSASWDKHRLGISIRSRLDISPGP
jgi:CRISPR/Cas system-associated protein Csm6